MSRVYPLLDRKNYQIVLRTNTTNKTEGLFSNTHINTRYHQIFFHNKSLFREAQISLLKTSHMLSFLKLHVLK
jgi:hypothetical protein